jgi:hypothetical protein
MESGLAAHPANGRHRGSNVSSNWILVENMSKQAELLSVHKAQGSLVVAESCPAREGLCTVHEELKVRLRFEKLLANLSATFVNFHWHVRVELFRVSMRIPPGNGLRPLAVLAAELVERPAVSSTIA